MKRVILFLLLVSCATVFVFAHGNNRQGQRQGYQHGRPNQYPQGRGSHQNNRPAAPERASVSGNLSIARGMIAVTSGDVTYLAGGLNRFTGFIDGLKEGAAVTLEGYAVSSPQNDKIKFLRVHKMTLNGRDYDLALPRQDANPRQNFAPPQNMPPRQKAPPHQNPYNRGRR